MVHQSVHLHLSKQCLPSSCFQFIPAFLSSYYELTLRQNTRKKNEARSRGPTDRTDGLRRVGRPQLLQDLPEEEMTELSDELAEELSTADLSVRRLAGLARRLAQVTETYVDQDPPK